VTPHEYTSVQRDEQALAGANKYQASYREAED
jgi:hypothetical protein